MRASDIGDGPISRISGHVYRTLALAIYLALTLAPTLIVWTLLVRDPSNAVLFWWALLPVAPALSGALHAMRAWRAEPELDPARRLWRGVRRTFADTMRWWLVVLVAGTVLIVNVVHAAAVPGGDIVGALSIVGLIGLVLWSGHLLILSAWFSFRTRDALRIAAASLLLQWRATLTMAALSVVVIGVVFLWSELVLVLIAWALVGWLFTTALPVADFVTERFTAHD